MDNKTLRESTLSFNFDESAYEAAAERPTIYRAMGREPRRSHPFWAYDDLRRQPELVAATLESAPGAMRHMADEIVARGARRLIFSGIGASLHLAMSAAHAMWRVAGIPAEWVDSAEALFSGAVFDYAGSVVVGLSASGNTAETVEHLRQAREGGALTFAFANLDNTRLTAAADAAYVAPGGYGTVWDYTTRLAAIYLLALDLARALGQPAEPLHDIEASLREIPGQMSAALQNIDERCASIARSIEGLRAAVVAATGNLVPVAWEMMIRFDEMAHFPALARPVVEFMHGGLGLLDSGIVTALLAPPGPGYPALVRAARVTQVVKSSCLAVVDEDDREVAALVDRVVRLPVTHPVLKPLLYVLPAQLIPYWVEASRPGGNPDALRTDRPAYAKAFDVAYPPRSH